jgi:hypothetical protein
MDDDLKKFSLFRLRQLVREEATVDASCPGRGGSPGASRGGPLLRGIPLHRPSGCRLRRECGASPASRAPGSRECGCSPETRSRSCRSKKPVRPPVRLRTEAYNRKFFDFICIEIDLIIEKSIIIANKSKKRSGLLLLIIIKYCCMERDLGCHMKVQPLKVWSRMRGLLNKEQVAARTGVVVHQRRFVDPTGESAVARWNTHHQAHSLTKPTKLP